MNMPSILQTRAVEISAPRQSAPVRHLTNEIAPRDPRSLFLSSDAVVLSDFMQAHPNEFQSLGINLPGSTIHQVNQTVNLLRTIHSARDEAGTHFVSQNVINEFAHAFVRPIDLQELAAAFDHIVNTTNSANQHLNNAFSDMARMILVTPASREDAVSEAERQASLFSEIFLANHRSHGMEAFEMALAMIS